MSDSALYELVSLDQTTDCSIPCWNGLTPGQSHITDIPDFFSRLGAFPYAYGDAPVFHLPNGELSRSEWVEMTGEGSSTQATAAVLGLDDIGVFWNPVDGTVQAIWVDFSRPPPGFDARSLFARLGRPDKVAIEYWGTEGGAIYTVLFTFPSEGALIAVWARPSQWPRLCLSGDDIQAEALSGPFITLVDPHIDPLDLTQDIGYGYGPLYPEDPLTAIGLSQDEFLDRVSTAEGCITLNE